MVFFAWGLLGASPDGQRFHADDRALKVLHHSTEVVEHLPRAISSVVRETEEGATGVQDNITDSSFKFCRGFELTFKPAASTRGLPRIGGPFLGRPKPNAYCIFGSTDS